MRWSIWSLKMYLRRLGTLVRQGSQHATCLRWTVCEEPARTFSIEISSILFLFWGKATKNVQCGIPDWLVVGATACQIRTAAIQTYVRDFTSRLLGTV